MQDTAINFTGINILRKMLQQAKSEGLTINVRHAKILFCGASSAGKSSFCRLLTNQEHEEVYKSTPVGYAQQVLISGERVNVVGSNWISLDTHLEIQELTRRLISRLQNQKDTNMDTAPIHNENSVLVADNKSTINNVQTDNQTITVATDDNIVDVPNLEVKDSIPKSQSSVLVANKPLLVFDYKFSDSIQTNKHVRIENRMVTYGDEVNTKDVPTTWDLFTLLDTGGQPEFINMLSAINTCTAITFIVLNMSTGKKYLNNSVVAQYECEGYNYTKGALKYTNMHLLKCLLSSVKVAAMKKEDYFHPEIINQIKKDEQSQPVVGIIGTCADVLKKEFGDNYNEEIFQINEEVKKLVEAIKKEGFLEFWCDAGGNYVIPVNNTISRNPQKENIDEDQDMQTMHLKTTFENVKTIRERSNKILEKRPQYEIPISWFILELELRNNSKVCIHLDEVISICNMIMPSHRIMNIKEIIEVLKFFHLYGMLLYFDKVHGMNEFVITNPQWLFNNLTKIIMCKVENKVYNAYYIENMQNGICYMELLRRLNLDLQGIELQSFVNLLVHLKIIAPMMDNGYFMPTILPPCDERYVFTEEEYGLPAAYSVDGHRICSAVEPLLIEFTFGTIPRGLFGFLIVQLLQKNTNTLQLYGKNDNVLRRCVDLISFCIRPCWYVSLCDKISYLELQVRVKNNEQSYHYKVQTAVTEALKLVCDEFSWQFSDCRYGFLCKEHPEGSEGEHLTLLSPSQPVPDEIPKYACCTNKNMPQDTRLEKFHSIWFEVC